MPQVAMIRTKELKITDYSTKFKGVEFCREDKTTNKHCGEVDPKKKMYYNELLCEFVCSVRSPESLFEESKKNKEKIVIRWGIDIFEVFIYKPASNKYFSCSGNNVYIPFFKNQKKCNYKKQINGIDHCLFTLVMRKGNCGQFMSTFGGSKSISKMCPKNQSCIIFPEDGWEEESRLDGHYLKSAKCI
jgi:hypothetical protein